MKKSLLALAVLGAFAGAAHAQTSVTIYGAMDVGLTKSTGSTTAVNAGDNNKLGFRGTEDLGGGLSALFQAEIRFDPNTGKSEGNGNRPLFQGSSVVGLSGGFGTLRLGRALSPMQATMPAYDAWGATRNRATFVPGIALATYNSNPLEPLGTMNRFSNGIFYTTPNMNGLQAQFAFQTKQAQDAGTPASAAFSTAATYANGPLAASLTYERNAIRDKFWGLGASYKMGTFTLMGTYANADNSTIAVPAAVAGVRARDAKAWTVSGKAAVGSGNFLVGYGTLNPNGGNNDTNQLSAGYEHNLSKRTFLYTDIKRSKTDGRKAVNTFDVGVHHNF